MKEPQTAPGWRVDETVRAQAIGAHDIESLRDTPALEAITEFASALCEAPVSLVSIVESQIQTFLAHTGTDLTETKRDVSFCAHAMLGSDIMVVPDATTDPRFADNALVTGAPGIRFYAGAPLVSDDGVPLGSLCVIDVAPRAGLTALQEQGLKVLAADVMARMQAARAAAA